MPLLRVTEGVSPLAQIQSYHVQGQFNVYFTSQIIQELGTLVIGVLTHPSRGLTIKCTENILIFFIISPLQTIYHIPFWSCVFNTLGLLHVKFLVKYVVSEV